MTMTMEMDIINKVEFRNNLCPQGHGSDDYETDRGDAYTITAFVGPQNIGHVDFNYFKVEVTELLEENILHIRWLEVEPDWQRQGIGGKLLDKMQAEFPGSLMETNGVTPEGRKFLDAYEDGEVFVDEFTRV